MPNEQLFSYKKSISWRKQVAFRCDDDDDDDDAVSSVLDQHT